MKRIREGWEDWNRCFGVSQLAITWVHNSFALNEREHWYQNCLTAEVVRSRPPKPHEVWTPETYMSEKSSFSSTGAGVLLRRATSGFRMPRPGARSIV